MQRPLTRVIELESHCQNYDSACVQHGVTHLGAVLLAAGRSSRMGRPKMLLPWAHTNVLGWHIHQWQALGTTQMAIVLSGPGPVWACLDRLSFPAEQRIINPDPGAGMFRSIQCASDWAGWKQTLSHFAIILGDQPHLRRATLARLLEFSAANPDRVCQPHFQDRMGHPIVMPRSVFATLKNATTHTLKDFLGQLSPGPLACDVDDPGLGLDLDTPEDYRNLARLPLDDHGR